LQFAALGSLTHGADLFRAGNANVPSTTVTGIIVASAKAGPLRAGDVITFTLQTSGPVTVTGTPRLTLSNGAFAAYAGADGSGRPVFSYKVAAGDTNTGALAVSGLDSQNGTVSGPTPQTKFAAATSVAVGSNPFALAVADVNGDNKLDLLTANYFGNSVSVRLGNGSGGFSGTTEVAVGSNPASIAVGDFNGDGKLDLAAANYGNASVSVRLGNGAGAFSGATQLTVDPNPISIAVGDVNGDGRPDLLTANYDSRSVSVRIADGTSSIFARYRDAEVGDGPRSVAVGDLDGDGKLDLITANSSDNTVSVCLGDGFGGFFFVADVAVGTGPVSVAVADVNGDGKLDMLAANNASSTVSVRLGNGAGAFSGTTEVAVGASPRSIVAADVNGDGKLDLVTANYSDGTVSVRLGNGAGAFSGTTEIAVGSAPTSVAVRDVNGDGKPDLLATNYGSGTVSVVLNTSTFAAPFDAATIAKASGAATGRAVDTQPPSAPLVSLSSDTGKSGADGITRSAALALSGVETGATLSYAVDGAAPRASYDPAALADGSHTVVVRQIDGAGNVSAAGTLAFTLDRAAAAPVMVLSADTGASGVDRVTNSGAITLFGVEKRAALSYAVDGGAVSAKYNPAGLADGGHTVVVTQTDLAGNISAASALAFTLDRAAPVVKAVTAAGKGISDGSGTLVTGGRASFKVTLSEAVTAAGDAAPVTLSLSNGAVARFDAGASDAKHLIFAYTVRLDDVASDLGVSGIKLNGATLKDVAGNTAKLSGAVGNPAGTLKIDGYTGTSRDDRFKGTSSGETFHGLAGDDTYTVNNKDDRVVEAKNGGRDTVVSSISFALGANVEALSLSGKGNTSGTGNGLSNGLTGNGAKNTLNGLDGGDTLIGGAGNDRLIGGKGSDKLYGGDGEQGSGNDTFVFAKLSDSTADTKGRDTIFDFEQGDRIDLSAIDASSKSKHDQAFKFIGADAFSGRPGELRYDKKASDTYVYADTDGDKRADFALHLDDAVKLAKEDFLL
jgi:hypothetical protein